MEYFVQQFSTRAYPPQTTVNIVVYEKVAEGINKQKDSFSLTFEEYYPNPDDPTLLLKIQEKLDIIYK